MTLPTDPKARKAAPVARGVLDYFPDALVAVAELSRIGNEQHNPGQDMHWAKEKSTDHADCIVRHLIDRGTTDTDGVRHSAKIAWRALALLQIELDAAAQQEGAGKPQPRCSIETYRCGTPWTCAKHGCLASVKGITISQLDERDVRRL